MRVVEFRRDRIILHKVGDQHRGIIEETSHVLVVFPVENGWAATLEAANSVYDDRLPSTSACLLHDHWPGRTIRSACDLYGRVLDMRAQRAGNEEVLETAALRFSRSEYDPQERKALQVAARSYAQAYGATCDETNKLYRIRVKGARDERHD